MGAILAILGVILKIIAWILLGLLGLIILVSLLILLPSLRYYIEGAKTEEDAHITARLSFFLHLIRVKFSWQKGSEVVWDVTLAHRKIAASYPLPQGKDKRKKHRQRRKHDEGGHPLAVPAEPEQPQPKQEAPSPPDTTPAPPPRRLVPVTDKPVSEPPRPEKKQQPLPAAPEKRRSKGLAGKLKAAWRRLVAWIQKLLAIPKKLKEKWDHLREEAEKLRDRWNEYPQKRETVAAVKELAIGLIRPVLPRAFRVHVRFGFNDPANTGKALGYYYALYPLLVPKETRRRKLEVEAEFENGPVLEANGWMRGHFALISFVPAVIRALRNAHIRRLIRFIRAKL